MRGEAMWLDEIEADLLILSLPKNADKNIDVRKRMARVIREQGHILNDLWDFTEIIREEFGQTHLSLDDPDATFEDRIIYFNEILRSKLQVQSEDAKAILDG
jgi:hypothetical protein